MLTLSSTRLRFCSLLSNLSGFIFRLLRIYIIDVFLGLIGEPTVEILTGEAFLSTLLVISSWANWLPLSTLDAWARRVLACTSSTSCLSRATLVLRPHSQSLPHREALEQALEAALSEVLLTISLTLVQGFYTLLPTQPPVRKPTRLWNHFF